ADINRDGFAELVVSPGAGGGPRLTVYDGRSFTAGGDPVVLVNDFFVFDASLRTGLYLTAGDVDGDGFADIVAGGGRRGGGGGDGQRRRAAGAGDQRGGTRRGEGAGHRVRLLRRQCGRPRRGARRSGGPGRRRPGRRGRRRRRREHRERLHRRVDRPGFRGP